MTSLLSAYGNHWNKQKFKADVLKQYDEEPSQEVTPIPKMGTPSVFWLHKAAWKYYEIVIPLLGTGDEIETCAGGSVTWSPTDDATLFGMKNIFLKHQLRDQNIFVRCPKPHYEYFYSFIYYTISPTNINKIIGISPSLTYDPIRTELVARSGNLGTNIALLNLALKLDKGIITINELNSKGLYAEILELTNKASLLIQLYKELTKMVPQDNGRYKRESTRFSTQTLEGLKHFI